MRNEHLVTLGLDPYSSHPIEEIKKAWRTKCKETHPDQGGTQEAFEAVMHAYKILTDPSYKQEQESQGMSNLHIRMNVPVTFEECFFGTTFTINFNQVTMSKTGEAIREEKYEIISEKIRIPAGTNQPIEVHIPKRGSKEEGTDRQGDAYLMIIPQRHPSFRMQGNDVYSSIQVKLETMLTGGVVDVATMYGIKEVKIPAGTAPGGRLLIPKCGVEKRGDHVVIVDPIFPTKQDLKKSSTWKKLKIQWEENE